MVFCVLKLTDKHMTLKQILDKYPIINKMYVYKHNVTVADFINYESFGADITYSSNFYKFDQEHNVNEFLLANIDIDTVTKNTDKSSNLTIDPWGREFPVHPYNNKTLAGSLKDNLYKWCIYSNLPFSNDQINLMTTSIEKYQVYCLILIK